MSDTLAQKPREGERMGQDEYRQAAAEAAQGAAHGQEWSGQVFDALDCLQQLCRQRRSSTGRDD